MKVEKNRGHWPCYRGCGAPKIFGVRRRSRYPGGDTAFVGGLNQEYAPKGPPKAVMRREYRLSPHSTKDSGSLLLRVLRVFVVRILFSKLQTPISKLPFLSLFPIFHLPKLLSF